MIFFLRAWTIIQAPVFIGWVVTPLVQKYGNAAELFVWKMHGFAVHSQMKYVSKLEMENGILKKLIPFGIEEHPPRFDTVSSHDIIAFPVKLFCCDSVNWQVFEVERIPIQKYKVALVPLGSSLKTLNFCFKLFSLLQFVLNKA